MATVYDIATKRRMPVEDPPESTWMDETDGMTDAEQQAFARGVAWSARLLCGTSDVPQDWQAVAEGERVVREYHQSRSMRLEAVR